MKRQRTITLAIATLLATGAACAQTAGGNSVQIYGFIAPMVDNVRVEGAAATAPADRPTLLRPGAYSGAGNGSQTRMQSSVTNLGLRGNEDLGGGLSAFFQLEHGFQVDHGGTTGAAGAPFFNRNTAVGLRGKFGTVFAGSWDTPIAWSHLGFTSGVRNPYAGDSSSIFLTPGFNAPHSATAENRGNSPADATFNRRQGNSLQYWSPAFSGFSFRLAYSLPEGEKTGANGTRYSPSVSGLGTEYASGPLVMRYVYQQQRDYFGLAWLGPNPAANPDGAGSTATGSKDTDHRLIARYTITPQWIVQGALDRLSYGAAGVATGSVQRYSRTAWSAQVVHRRGEHSGWVNVGAANDGSCSTAGGGACSTKDLGARMWSAGYRYDFSRRTDVFASVYSVRNRASGQYGVFPRSTAGIAPGAHHSGLSLGLEHSF